jgi:hypothetical protein
LLACYRRSPFFEYYEEGLRKLFSSKCGWLVDWNLACMDWTLSAMKTEVVINKTSSFKDLYDPSGYLDFRNLLTPQSRLLPGIKDVPYKQVFGEEGVFIQGLSILDLLFCEGPRATDFLKLMKEPEK